MGRVSDSGDPMPPRESWKEYAERVLKMIGDNEEERKVNLQKAMEALNESLTVARNIHRKTSHMEVARDFYMFALEMNNSKKKSPSKQQQQLVSTPPDKRMKSSSSVLPQPKGVGSPATKQLKRDGRGRFISSSSSTDNNNKNDDGGNTANNYNDFSPTTSFLAAHNDFCQVCEYGGELICCASCNLVFHLECLRPKLLKLPPDDWNCPYCISSGSLGHKRGSIVRSKAMAGVRVMDSEAFKESCRQMKAPIAARVIAAAAAAAAAAASTTTTTTTTEPQNIRVAEAAKNDISSSTNNSKENVSTTDSATAADSSAAAATSKEEGRCRRIRQPATRYDPQLCPASKWQSDEVVHLPSSTTAAKSHDTATLHPDQTFSSTSIKKNMTSNKPSKPKIYFEDEENCGFCHGAMTVPICCFCACRICFRKKDKDVLHCAQCQGKYHKACLRRPDIHMQNEEWLCPDCTENDATAKVYRKKDAHSTASASFSDADEEESQESSTIQDFSDSKEDYGEEENETFREDQHSDNSSLFEEQQSEFADKDQSNRSMETALLKRKRGRPPKLKTESFSNNNNIELDDDSVISTNKDEDSRNLAVLSHAKKKRGRPFKAYVKGENNAEPLQPHIHHLHGSKKKRGRPLKKVENDLEDNGSAISVGSSHFVLKKRGRGRPRKKVQQLRESPYVRFDEENYDEVPDEAQPGSVKRKRGRPPKFSSPEGLKNHVTIGGHEPQVLGKRKRGRPPKLRNNDIDEVPSPAKKRGRPFKQKQQQDIVLQKSNVKHGQKNERQWTKSMQHSAVDSSLDGDSQQSCFGQKKTSDYNYSDSVSFATGEGESSSRGLGCNPDALFYEDRLIGDHDTYSQISVATASKSSSSSVNREHTKNDGSQTGNFAALCAPAISRSGRPLKPNSLLFELGGGEQHLRSAKYAADQQMKKNIYSKIPNLDNFFGRGGTANNIFKSASAGEPFTGMTSKVATDLAVEPSYAVPVAFPPGEQAATSAGTSLSASAPSLESRTTCAFTQQQEPMQPVQIYVDMGLQHRSTFDDLSQHPNAITSSLKQPRRKPGARECMQISRRFHTQVIPARYMEVLLDYVNRGKIEHLVRMRERLDEHSRLLESQLAGLEALVREKGECNETEADATNPST